MVRGAGLAGLIDRQELPDDVRRILAEILADQNHSTNMLTCLDEILHHFPGWLVILQGPELRYLRINKRLADLNGLPIKAHPGKPLASVLPHARAVLLPEILKVMNSGSPILESERNLVGN